MLGKQDVNTDLFQCVSMEQLVPPNHMLRRLAAVMDLRFVRESVAHLYSAVGRNSADPEVVVRMWILQHLYDFSERQICDEVTMHAGFRWFCGLSFNDAVPDQSTLVKLRNLKWADTGLWDKVLAATIGWCEAAGISRPGRMGIDGTQITANAATVSLEQIPPPLRVVELEDAAPPRESANVIEPVALVIEEGGNPREVRRSGDPEWHGEKFSNATHRSTTDPQARLYRKGKSQEAKLRYLGHYLADLRSGVIYGAVATQATGTAEREAALKLLDQLTTRPDELVMDLGYRDGEFLAAIIERGVQPIVPLGQQPLEEVPTFARRTFDMRKELDRRSRQAAARARNATRLAARGSRGAAAQRQRTRLEHLIGEGKEHHGLDRAYARGLTRVDQQIKLTASVQNLKRLVNSLRRGRGGAQALFGWQYNDAIFNWAAFPLSGAAKRRSSRRKRQRIQRPGRHSYRNSQARPIR